MNMIEIPKVDLWTQKETSQVTTLIVRCQNTLKCTRCKLYALHSVPQNQGGRET